MRIILLRYDYATYESGNVYILLIVIALSKVRMFLKSHSLQSMVEVNYMMYNPMNYKISVIIPCYNTEPVLLLPCIVSILNQTYHNYEIIIVDDGSYDDYRKIYSDIKRIDNRISVVYQANKGVSSARNIGVSLSTGDYIVFIDSDDEISKTFFQEAIDAIVHTGSDMVTGCYVRNKNVLQKVEKAINLHTNLHFPVCTFEGDDLKELIPKMVSNKLKFCDGLMSIGSGCWSRVVRGDIARRVRFDEELTILEDVIWNIQMVNICKKVSYVIRPWYIYNNNASSAVHTYDTKTINNNELGLWKLKEMLNLDNDKEFMSFCNRCWEDQKRIYNIAIKLDRKTKMNIVQQIYKSNAWSVLRQARCWIYADWKMKVKLLLYYSRLIYLKYEIAYKLSH